MIPRAATLAVASLLAFTLFTANAGAHFLNHGKRMSLNERVVYFEHSIDHDRAAVARDVARLRALERTAPRRTLSEVIGTHRAPGLVAELVRRVRWHRAAFRWHRDLLRRYEAKYAATLLPPHHAEWLCIHSYEGSWDDPNPPFWGGLQMDYAFMAAYGASLLRSKGTADNWTPLEQMWVAEKAYSSGRGFGPWPNTARYCGLL